MLMRKLGVGTTIVAGALSYASLPSLAQTLNIGVRAGPESIDPHFTATANQIDQHGNGFIAGRVA